MTERHILIADAGSTKTEWCLAADDGRVDNILHTRGLNALSCRGEELADYFKAAKAQLSVSSDPESIFYYGAGCATGEICRKVTEALSATFPDASVVETASDMLGAARSLLGSEEGIACILGTGANSCRYDGQRIVGNVPALGYILGDEGSGGTLGRQIVADALKGTMPEPLRTEFVARYNLSLGDVLDRVYRTPGANRYLASFVPFLKDHIEAQYCRHVVENGFREFFTRNVERYDDYREFPVAFTGSVAYHFADILRDIAAERGIRTAHITETPMASLIRYHTS